MYKGKEEKISVVIFHNMTTAFAASCSELRSNCAIYQRLVLELNLSVVHPSAQTFRQWKWRVKSFKVSQPFKNDRDDACGISSTNLPNQKLFYSSTTKERRIKVDVKMSVIRVILSIHRSLVNTH